MNRELKGVPEKAEGTTAAERAVLEHCPDTRRLLEGRAGGFYYHPSDEVGALWASVGTAERKSYSSACFRSTAIPKNL